MGLGIGFEFIGLKNLGLGLKGFGSLSLIDWVKDLFGFQKYLGILGLVVSGFGLIGLGIRFVKGALGLGLKGLRSIKA